MTIPGLHLHGISEDRNSGGHVRNLVTRDVTAHVWLDDLVLEAEPEGSEKAIAIDFDRYEGPVSKSAQE
jgi:alpha-acetolactate decarboxylase